LYFLVILSNTYLNPFIDGGSRILASIVGGFSSYGYGLPLFLTLLCFLVLLITLMHKDKAEDGAIRAFSLPLDLGFLGALILLVLAVTYAMYTGYATLPSVLGSNAIWALGVQGRYFTASLIFLVPLFLWLRRYVSFAIKPPVTIGVIVFSAAAFWLL